jgi:hypothetical protein
MTKDARHSATLGRASVPEGREPTEVGGLRSAVLRLIRAAAPTATMWWASRAAAPAAAAFCEVVPPRRERELEDA